MKKKTGPKIGSKHKNVRNRKFKLPPGEMGFNKLYGLYKYNSKVYNREFSLTKIEFKAITQMPCTYCGSKNSGECIPHGQTNSLFSVQRGTYLYTGIDRIDNNQGYIISNVVPCCFMCNRAKSTVSSQEFSTWIGNLIAHNLMET